MKFFSEDIVKKFIVLKSELSSECVAIGLSHGKLGNLNPIWDLECPPVS